MGNCHAYDKTGQNRTALVTELHRLVSSGDCLKVG
jgi:hypothetical protein